MRAVPFSGQAGETVLYPIPLDPASSAAELSTCNGQFDLPIVFEKGKPCRLIEAFMVYGPNSILKAADTYILGPEPDDWSQSFMGLQDVV